jgi:hypothetical protein
MLQPSGVDHPQENYAAAAQVCRDTMVPHAVADVEVKSDATEASMPSDGVGNIIIFCVAYRVHVVDFHTHSMYDVDILYVM